MTYLKSLIPTLCVCMLLCACDDSIDGGSVSSCKVTINIELPEEVQSASVSDEVVVLHNISNGSDSEFMRGEDIRVIPGLYDINYSAKAVLSNGVESQLRAMRTSVIIEGDETTVVLNPHNNIASNDFIISEIFFAGTMQTSGNSYSGDQYVKIYNNTDKVLYADGLTLFESKFMTTEKYDYSPDVMSEAVTVHALYTIPGSGHEHPVQPGGCILLADAGIDHRQINPNSFDLSHADWEWYDVSTNPKHQDVDSPEVPNLDKVYCYTQTIFTLHNRGFRCFGLARIPVGNDAYLSDYKYTYSYEMVLPTGTYPMSQSSYKMPNEWVVDAVNCSVASDYVWNVCDASLDMGWTWCGTIDKDKTRFFRAVRRKLLYRLADGTPVYKDTNNSAADFNPHVVPSEIERQGTVIDIDGTRAAVVTYDGITPVEE